MVLLCLFKNSVLLVLFGVVLWLLKLVRFLVLLLKYIINVLLLMFDDCGFISVSINCVVIVVLIVELFSLSIFWFVFIV